MISPGYALPSVVKFLTQEKINLYAKASGDFNPIHIDEAFAAKTELGGTIAHGMLLLAYISEMMTQAFKGDWLSGGKLNVRFKKPARPGDVISVSGRVKSVEGTHVLCQVVCHNQDGEELVAGEAVAELHHHGIENELVI